MQTKLFYSILVAAALTPAVCFAQASTTTGAVGGAVTGAVVGGPVGAVVGGVVGGAIGAAAEPPREVYTYVERENVPSVAVHEQVVVGRPLPTTVEIRTVPNHEAYAYAVVNNHRVIVDHRTRKVLKVIE